METPGCLSNVKICIATPLPSQPRCQPAASSAGGKFTDRKQRIKKKSGKKKKTHLCHISSLADCTSTCRLNTEPHGIKLHVNGAEIRCEISKARGCNFLEGTAQGLLKMEICECFVLIYLFHRGYHFTFWMATPGKTSGPVNLIWVWMHKLDKLTKTHCSWTSVVSQGGDVRCCSKWWRVGAFQEYLLCVCACMCVCKHVNILVRKQPNLFPSPANYSD